MDLEKEQLKLEINQLKQVILQYQQRDLIAGIQALSNPPASPASGAAPDYFAEPKSPHDVANC